MARPQGHWDMIKQPVHRRACGHSRDRATLGTQALGFSGLHWNVLQVLGLSASPFHRLLLLSLALLHSLYSVAACFPQSQRAEREGTLRAERWSSHGLISVTYHFCHIISARGTDPGKIQVGLHKGINTWKLRSLKANLEAGYHTLSSGTGYFLFSILAVWQLFPLPSILLLVRNYISQNSFPTGFWI